MPATQDRGMLLNPEPTGTDRLDNVGIDIYGKPYNLRLPWLVKQPPPEWIDDASHGLEMLRGIATRAGVTNVFVPKIDECNAQVMGPRVFEVEVEFKGIKVLRGPPVDGIILPAGAMAIFRSADCPTIVAKSKGGNDAVIVAHAGRGCLIDESHLHGNNERCHASVVDAIMVAFGRTNPRDISVRIVCGISPERFDHGFDHPTYGPWNTKLIGHLIKHWGLGVIAGEVNYGRIDLPALIKAQFAKHGVKDVTHDGIDTATDPRFHSWRSDDDCAGRNGVVVYNPPKSS